MNLGRLFGWVGLLVTAMPLLGQVPRKPVGTPYELQDAFPSLQFNQPLAIASAPGDRTRLFIVEKGGHIQVVTGLDGAQPAQKTFLDLSHPRDGTLETDSECGVLGLAFPPDYARSGRFYVYYSLKIHNFLRQRLSRFQVKAGDPSRGDEASEQPLFTQPDEAPNHNGGDLHFGPDGYLYISVGDGGAGGDKLNNARFIDEGFYAGILRIDPDKRPGNLPPNAHRGVARGADGSAFYSVPRDNPFVGATSYHAQAVDSNKVRTELWATGMRNPWRFSFDAETGRLFAGDVGQDLYEEIDLVTRGGDYGWSYREGLHPFTTGPGLAQEPPGFAPVPPIFEYPRAVGSSVIGGVVYHGSRYPQLEGAYIFGDFVSGRVIALRNEGKALWSDELLAQEPGIAGIGYDPRDGEVLFANLGLGKIKRLHPKATAR